MNTKLMQWGAAMVVLGVGSFLLPMLGIQFRIFNLFGAHQTEAAIGSIVIGAVLFIVCAIRGRSDSASEPAQPNAPTASVPPPLPPPASGASSPATCPKCGAKAAAGDRFCMECGGPLPAVVPAPPPPQQQPPAQAPPVIQPPAPARRRKSGCLISLAVLLLLLGGGAWVFMGMPKPYQPPARTEPAVPARMAGTLAEFPVDPSPTQPLQPTEVVSQSFQPTGYGTTASQKVQAPAESLPPGLNTSSIPTVASAMTSSTYRSGDDPQSPPVYVHVMQTGQNPALAGQFAQGIAQNSGATLQGARVQSPQGQVYQGYTVRTVTILVYILMNPNAGTLIILYAPRPESFAATQRLAGSVGNGRGLRDYPQIADPYASLPAAPPPGYQLANMRGFTGGQINAALARMEQQIGRDATSQLNQALNTVRVFIPDHGMFATYRDPRGQEKGVLIGGYGSHFRARAAWRFLFWTFGWVMQRNDTLGFEALTITDSGSRIMIFQKGPYIGLAAVPGACGERELFDLTRSVQF
ncbi:MAG: hypothetical protein HZC54_12130 [Verrucomicrobia bacterium]|nr:hypothetical protein [Verrucomicrobiota bacterium]